MKQLLDYPYDWNNILRKSKEIKDFLLSDSEGFIPKKIAVMSGSTINHITTILELFCLNKGIKPEFYESDYGQFYEEVVFNNQQLLKFNPDVILIHTNYFNLTNLPLVNDDDSKIERKINDEFERYSQIWNKINQNFESIILQNNFEFPLLRSLGDLDIILSYGITSYVNKMNLKFADTAKTSSNLYINDINYMSARVGIENWINMKFWRAYRYFMDFRFMPLYCNKIASKIASIYGLSKKSIITDLDNVMWGGIVGDDGPNNIHIGEDTPEGEGFIFYQKYLKELYERGITLNISSKNNEKVALEGLNNEANILGVDNFSKIKANWLPKSKNIKDIVEELNISSDTTIFIDDSNFERNEVKASMQEIEIPNMSVDPINNVNILDQSFYFETHKIINEDINKSQFYKTKTKFDEHKNQYENYEEFLKSLDMQMHISILNSETLKRSTQLNNKTNQFNFMTTRLTESEMNKFITDNKKIAYCVKLSDKFGDSGMISLIMLTKSSRLVNIDNWLMSCRVFKRGIEQALMNFLIKELKMEGYEELNSIYIPTNKNKFVENLFDELGFQLLSSDDEGKKKYQLDLNQYKEKTHQIEVSFER